MDFNLLGRRGLSHSLAVNIHSVGNPDLYCANPDLRSEEEETNTTKAPNWRLGPKLPGAESSYYHGNHADRPSESLARESVNFGLVHFVSV